MPNAAWKQFERECGDLIKGKRFPANQGGGIDVEGPDFCGQCKNVLRASLAWVEDLTLAIDIEASHKDKLGVLFVKRRAGKGYTTPTLVVMTTDTFKEIVDAPKDDS